MVSGSVLECDVGSQDDNSSRVLLIHLENSSDWLNRQATDITTSTSTSESPSSTKENQKSDACYSQ